MTLAEEIERGLATRDLAAAIESGVTSAEDARALLAALPRLPVRDDAIVTSPIGVVAMLLQGCGDDDAVRTLHASFEQVHAFYDRVAADAEAQPGDVVFLLKAYALHASRGGLERVAAAARDRRFADEFLWSIVLGIYAREGHPLADDMIASLREPLPVGFAAVAFLDACNTLAREGRLPSHPFASVDGRARLHAWIGNRDPEHFSFAHSAAAAIPFVAGEGLLEAALSHPDAAVRMEAAWADATTGGERGVAALVNACADPHRTLAAQAYLRELGREALIPPQCSDPVFLASAEMSGWLQHPNELARVPDRLELRDTRELFWPPTNDRRRVYLFEYESGDHRGLGMVGSVTFALFGEATSDLTPEDAYALHCCWELEMNEDPRAPSQRSVDAGRQLLGFGPR